MWKPIALQVEKVLLYIWRVACSGAPQRTSIRNEGARSLMFRVSFSPLKFSCTAALKALEAPKGSFGSQFRYDYLKSPLERDTVPKCTVPNILCIYHIYIHSIYIYIYIFLVLDCFICCQFPCFCGLQGVPFVCLFLCTAGPPPWPFRPSWLQIDPSFLKSWSRDLNASQIESVRKS